MPASKTVTVTKLGKSQFQITFSMLPDRTFGPWSFAETVKDLTVSALLPPVDARNLAMDAGVLGHATSSADY